ncbi:hypothetical protein K445DRAFT_306317 [Daldinia sp. EC12]|nr:hypothetical protein K445DRAFT_306317 [Daldinia sp. EC12]
MSLQAPALDPPHRKDSSPNGVNNVKSKPSKSPIRALELYTFRASIEAHLNNGILLTHIGDTIVADEANYQPYLEPEIDVESSDGGVSFIPEYPTIPIERPPTPCSESTVSSESPMSRSFSIPASSTFGSPLSHRDSSRETSLADALNCDPPISEAVPINKRNPDISEDDVTLGPWRNLMRMVSDHKKTRSQRKSYLTFNGDRFGVNIGLEDTPDLSYSSEADSIDMYDGMTNSRENNINISAYIEERYVLCSWSYGTNIDLSLTDPEQKAFQYTFLDDLFRVCAEEIYDGMCTMLDDRYWRAHGPQRSYDKGRNKAQKENDTRQPSVGPYDQSRSLTRYLLKDHRPRRGRKNGSKGSSSSEDPMNTDPRHPPASGRKGNALRVGCPFHKHDPHLFAACAGVGFKKISHVKQHLKTKHQESHCEACLRTITPNYLHSHRCLGRSQKGYYITEEMAVRLSQRADRKQTLEEQWLEVYTTVFPEDVAPFPSPYVESINPGTLEHFVRFLRDNLSSSWQEMVRCLPPGVSVPPELLKDLWYEGNQRWLSKAIETYQYRGRTTLGDVRVSGADGLDLTDDQEQTIQPNSGLLFEHVNPGSTTEQPYTQQPSNHVPSPHSGLDPKIIDESFANTNLQTVSDTQSNHIGFGSLQTDPLNGIEGIMANPFMGAPAKLSPQPQYDAFDETWFADFRGNIDGSATPIVLGSGPDPSLAGLDWMDPTDHFAAALDEFSFGDMSGLR